MYTRRFISTVQLSFDLWSPLGGAKSATPIIFLHGLFGSKKNNKSASKTLANNLGCDIYCLDLRNHGDSLHIRRHDYAALGADVVKFVECHKLDRPIIIGHSMGARTAMGLALTHSEMLSKLIVVDHGPVPRSLVGGSTLGLCGDGIGFDGYIRAMRNVNDRQPSTQKEANEFLGEYEKDLGIRQFLLANFKRLGNKYQCRLPLDYLEEALPDLANFEYSPYEYQFTGPTLLIRGSKSPFVPNEDIPAMRGLFPKVEVQDVDCGHWVISERPKEFIDHVQAFLRK